LYGPLDLILFALSDVCSDRLCCALRRFGGDLQAGQDLHLFAAVIERGRSPHYRQHAAHPGRQFRIGDVQFLSTGNCP
jgi:hypothetical protein